MAAVKVDIRGLCSDQDYQRQKNLRARCARRFYFFSPPVYTDAIIPMIIPDEKYIWTQHAQRKMRHYRLTEARIKRVIRYPSRIEESIVSGAIACMQAAEGKQYSEIWAMYVLLNARRKEKKIKQMKIITAWRYPGKSPERDPVPAEVLREIKAMF